MIDASRPGRNAAGFRRTRDMLDDTGALDEQIVDRIVDPVEFGPQRGQTTATPAIHGSWLLLPAGGFDCWNWAGHHSRRKGVADLYQRPLEVTRKHRGLTRRTSQALFALADCCGIGCSENGLADAHSVCEHSEATRCEQRPQVLCNAAMDQPATRSDLAKSYNHAHVTFDDGIELECGTYLRRHAVAYRTYGTLNADRSNAVLVCHALTGDQYVAEEHPITGKPGWWDTVVGPGLPMDTDRFFVICPNVLGGCMGSTGPLSKRELPDGTVIDEPWGTEFPPVTIRDMVRAQKRLIEHLGIDRLFAVHRRIDGWHAGAAMGGAYPDRRCSRLCRSPPLRIIRPRTSPSRRSAVRPSSRTQTGKAANTGAPAAFPPAAWPSRGCAPTSPICPRKR